MPLSAISLTNSLSLKPASKRMLPPYTFLISLCIARHSCSPLTSNVCTTSLINNARHMLVTLFVGLIILLSACFQTSTIPAKPSITTLSLLKNLLQHVHHFRLIIPLSDSAVIQLLMNTKKRTKDGKPSLSIPLCKAQSLTSQHCLSKALWIG